MSQQQAPCISTSEVESTSELGSDTEAYEEEEATEVYIEISSQAVPSAAVPSRDHMIRPGVAPGYCCVPQGFTASGEANSGRFDDEIVADVPGWSA